MNTKDHREYKNITGEVEAAVDESGIAEGWCWSQR